MAEPTEGQPALEPGLVTIAIPTFNGSRFLLDALGSAVRQTYDRIEILVVDDASEDGSAELAEEFARQHPGIALRVVLNRGRLGLAGNWNHCIDLAKGEFLKFLFQDDLLEPECVEEMVRSIEVTPNAGMTFSRRKLRVDGPVSAMTRRWIARHGEPHTRFARLEPMNDGRRLFREQMSRDPFRNWIGEPTAVLLRTELAREVGGFNLQLKQRVDTELWLRLMCHGDVAFLNKPLATFRLHSASATSHHARCGAAWLDPLWMVDGLLADGCVRREHLPVRLLHMRALTRVIAGEAVRVLGGRPPAAFRRAGEFLAWLRR